jgi:Pregnancy-associated plasma protein-A
LVAGINSAALGSGVAGYAYLPYSHGLPEDGIVNEASWFGSSSDNSKVHIHEVGHYLGLYHTFQNGCANLDCTLDGDQVCDTPPDGSTGASPCGISQNSCSSDEDDTSANNPFRPVLLGGLGDQNDLIENYMDYSAQACQTLFTAGQSERMNAALENERASLLGSGGCVSSCGIGPVEINDELDIFLAGTSFSLTQNTLAIVDVDFQWTFNGEIISTDSTLNYTFTNAQIGDGYLVLNVINTELDCSIWKLTMWLFLMPPIRSILLTNGIWMAFWWEQIQCLLISSILPKDIISFLLLVMDNAMILPLWIILLLEVVREDKTIIGFLVVFMLTFHLVSQPRLRFLLMRIIT